MALLIAILTLALVALVVALVSAPLRRRAVPAPTSESAATRASHEQDADARALREELEAAREAKYREIRDCELDFRTGKLSAADYAALDAQLRAEAIGILDRLERVGAEREGESEGESESGEARTRGA